ncbi:nucleolar protein 58-like isoform X2 [Penaeus japonicus]|nr:nucleolar protein 58-like isoform X2 [Penaeus japonicus]XP_042888575.1 nucleolar protein 58-like isoform X2 [Penaeus japonicus]
MEPRRSSRPVIKPVKFWDFEKPDFSKTEHISYSITELTKTFVRSDASAKPKKQPQINGISQEKLTAKNHIPKKSVPSAKPRNHQRVKQLSADKKPREKRNEETDLSKTSQKSDSIPEATPVSHEKALTKRKLVKDFKRKIKNHQNTLQTTSNSTMCTVSIMNATDISRRSGRVRVKPLEFWNFEKIEVKKDDDGHVQVISHKQNAPEPRKRQPQEVPPDPVSKDQSTALRKNMSPKKRKKSKEEEEDDVDKRRKSPKKRVEEERELDHQGEEDMDVDKRRKKTFSRKMVEEEEREPDHQETVQKNLKEKVPTTKDRSKEEGKQKEFGSRSKDNTQEEGRREPEGREGGEREERQEPEGKEGGGEREETSHEGSAEEGLQVMEFKDLYFLHCETEKCNCYLAKSYEDPRRGVFAGFVFLEGGSLLWQAKKEMFLKVISGRGTLKIVDTETKEGVHMMLMNKGSATVTTGKRIEIVKDRRCKMIKFFVEIRTADSKKGND